MMTQREIQITAKNVLVKFGNFIALNDFSVEIPRDIVGLLGPNGAGKTTFTRVLLGLEKPQCH